MRNGLAVSGMRIDNTGNVFIGGNVVPTAMLTIRPGTTFSAQLRLLGGGALATGSNILPGNIEFLSDKFYGTITTGPSRKEFIQGDNAITDAVNIVFGTTIGTKIGTSVTQKLAFYNSTPITQPASANQAAVVAGPAGPSYGATERSMLNQIKTLVNQLRNDLVSLGLIKGSA